MTYLGNDVLNANSFFGNRAGQEIRRSATTSSAPPLVGRSICRRRSSGRWAIPVVVNEQANQPRIIQFALKLIY
jgi:hypothetical protein